MASCRMTTVPYGIDAWMMGSVMVMWRKGQKVLAFQQYFSIGYCALRVSRIPFTTSHQMHIILVKVNKYDQNPLRHGGGNGWKCFSYHI